MILLHSILSLLSFLHPLISNAWMSSSISSTPLFLGLPLILLPIGFHYNILLGILFSSIRITCPNQAILLLFMNRIMSAFPMSSFNSWFILILQDPSLSCTGPKIFLNILRSNILRCRSSLVVKTHYNTLSLRYVCSFHASHCSDYSTHFIFTLQRLQFYCRLGS